ncbi:unnamed protein product [Mucor circinelloides]
MPVSWRATLVRGTLVGGYARKSKGKERITTRSNLLNEMVHRLRKRSLCTKVYVSSYCDANQPLESRDSKRNYKHHLALIKNCDGDMTMQLLKTKFKPIRLAAIDFAGLSTEPNDIRAFISPCKIIRSASNSHPLTLPTITNDHLVLMAALTASSPFFNAKRTTAQM